MTSYLPSVCICIPNYNNANTVAQTLDSILAQSYKNIKIKVFDNASNDDSLTILRAYEKDYSQIEVFTNDENIGGEANFEKCIQHMEGDFAAIYHSDDVYLPKIVEKQVEFFNYFPECNAVSTHAYEIDRNGNRIGKRHLPKNMRGKKYFIFRDQLALYKKILQYNNFIICPSVMARTEVFRNHIKTWNGKDYKTAADLDVWLRFSDIGAFGFINEPLMCYRVSEASLSYNMARMKTTANDIFLVLDDYHSKSEIAEALNDDDHKNLAYLVFMDNVNRVSNSVILGRSSDIKLPIQKLSIISCAVTSTQNLKFYTFGILVVLMRPFSSVPMIKQFLKYLKYRRK